MNSCCNSYGSEFRSARYRKAQVAESGMSMSAAPFHVPSANTRLAYVPRQADKNPGKMGMLMAKLFKSCDFVSWAYLKG